MDGGVPRPIGQYERDSRRLEVALLNLERLAGGVDSVVVTK